MDPKNMPGDSPNAGQAAAGGERLLLRVPPQPGRRKARLVEHWATFLVHFA